MTPPLVVAILAAITLQALAVTHYSVNAWLSEDGLPGNVVRSLVQSSDGYLWVASAEGISRFDGIDFQTLEIPENLKFPRIGPTRLFATPGAVIWFSGQQVGLLRIESGELSQVLKAGPYSTSDQVTQVVAINPKTVVARRGHEVWLVSASPPERLHSPSPEIIAHLEHDLAERSVTGRILPDGSPRQLIDRKGGTWANDGDHGIRATSPDGEQIPLDFGGLGNKPTATEFLEDWEGNIWVAHNLNGLIRLRPLRAEILNDADGLTDSAIVAVIEDDQQQFWFGNRKSGVDRMRHGVVEHFELSPDTAGRKRAVTVLYIDRDKRLWAAARGGSVFTWDGEQFQVVFPREVIASKIDAIYHDSMGNHWFGGIRGLAKVTEDTITPMGLEQGAPVGHVTCMGGDDSGRLWFGLATGEVFRHENGDFVALGGEKDLGGHQVSSLLVENGDHAWVTTLGSGLNYWDGHRWHRFDRDQGLPDSRLTCILTDDRDNFWFGSLGGVFRISRSELLAHIQDPSAPLHWMRLDRADGLPTREFSGSSVPSGWRDHAGQLYFASSKGVARINPESITINNMPPPVHLAGVSANGIPLEDTSAPMITGPGKTRLVFSYHGLAYSAPESVSYRTRLKGRDSSWRETGNQRVSIFDAVPPGTYEFEVRACNRDGIWSVPSTLAKVIVEPFIWQTKWFLALSVVALLSIAGGVGWIIARGRMRQRFRELQLTQALEVERSRISRDLHDDLGASLTEVSQLSALALENPDSEVLRPTLEMVSRKSSSVVAALDEIVWAATPAEDSLRSMVDYLYAFVREFLGNVQISLRSDVVRSIPDIPLGPNRRHNIFLTTREAINNSVKHSQATEIRFQISLEDGQLIIRVADNGIGFSTDSEYPGSGLTNLKRRMTDCGGTCSIHSQANEGTTVTITLPLPPAATTIP